MTEDSLAVRRFWCKVDACCGAGAYRQLHARLRTNAEPVAFYGGITKEGALIRERFRQLIRHERGLLTTQWRFSMWQVRTRCHPRHSRVGGATGIWDNGDKLCRRLLSPCAP